MTGIAEFRVVSSPASSAFGSLRGPMRPHVYALPTPLRMRAHAVDRVGLLPLVLSLYAVRAGCAAELGGLVDRATQAYAWATEGPAELVGLTRS